MAITSTLRIYCADIEGVQGVMEIPRDTVSGSWSTSLNDKDHGSPVTFIDRLLTVLEGKEELLAALGVQADDITLWVYYAYDEQCNLEFDPAELGRLARRGISLCVSCWKEA